MVWEDQEETGWIRKTDLCHEENLRQGALVILTGLGILLMTLSKRITLPRGDESDPVLRR